MGRSKKSTAGKIVLIVSIIFIIVKCIAYVATDLGNFTSLDALRMILGAVPGVIGAIVGIVLLILGKKSERNA